MRAMIAVAFLLPLAAALNLHVSKAAEEQVSHRLKAGRDLSGEEPEAKAPLFARKTLQSVAKAAKKQRQLHQVEKMDLMADMTVEQMEQAEVKLDASVAPFRPRMELIASEWKVGKDTNVEVFWQRPTGEVKGVMFGATGCFHQAGDFFEQHHSDGWEFQECKNSKLQRCQGLPDNVHFNKYARERGYLFMTITPQGKNSCWEHKNDPKRANLALQHVLKKEGLPLDTPMFASGASQGGYFMFDLQRSELPNLKCIAPQCAEIKDVTHKEHLPTMFIYMTKDHETSWKIDGSINYLKKRLDGKVAVRTPHPWAVPELMQARGFSQEKVDKISAALQKAKGAFGHAPITHNGYLVDHPGTDAWWKPAVRKVVSEEEDSLAKDHSVMHHLMQVAFAEHEFTAEYTDHIIDFCESNGLVDPTSQPLRFGRKMEGGLQKFKVKASGIYGAEE